MAINHEELARAWQETPAGVRRALRDYSRYPTERNSCYVTGYLAASADCGHLPKDAYQYWVAALDSVPAMREVLALDV